jgi:malate dehydrogenase (oxaloacetate-decarboxylating)(NADP+)
MSDKNLKKDALDYHECGRPGKIEVIPTKPYSTQRDLTLAYSPGVAEPCMEIQSNPDNAYRYTSKGNLVAVISNGTAVLGLGDIGALASKPVMEGKGMLFKIYADIDVFDIEINTKDPDEFVQTVKNIAPTFGGINLEDIKAPECFYIEKRLKEELDIPLMHDDQHGTAIISAAALMNAVELAGKKMDEIKIVVNGAGASAISCSKMYLALGVKKENIYMFDSKGLLSKLRHDLDEHKVFFALHDYDISLPDALMGADVFVGLSKGNILTPEMVKSMAENPIVFALANPVPEISYKDAKSARPDAIVATGRSDNPNQVNNVLGFPFIFRGALDVLATGINEEMKLAATKALAQLAKEPVPDYVLLAYGLKNLSFGPDYIIPKPIDNRLIVAVSMAVAKAAIDSGIARKKITDWDAYAHELESRLGKDNKLMRNLANKAKTNPKRIVFAEADQTKILKAAQMIRDEGIAFPILLGNKNKIERIAQENGIDISEMPIIDPLIESEDKRKEFGEMLWYKRQRKGVTLYDAVRSMRDRNYFGCMMVEVGLADAMISGYTRKYAIPIRPALECIGVQQGVKKVAGLYVMITKRGPMFLADTTMTENPTAEELVEIALLTARTVQQFNITPKIAMLSYSNFGSVKGEVPEKVAKAVRILHENYPGLIVDGDVQANFALNKTLIKEQFPFSQLANQDVNTLIFPNLASGNIAYKLIQELAGAEAIGPILMGLKKPVHILQLGSSVREIVNMAIIAVVDAQNKKN